MTVSVVEVTELTKRYRNTLAVDRASFRIEKGEVFGFLGPNGSGKTTTIGMILDVIRPTSGEIRLFGESGEGGLHAARRRVGATLETPNFYPYLSGYENLRIVATIKGVGRREIDAALNLVGLTARARTPFRTYSLGMKQRLAIAAATLGDPDLILLDEPLNGLDPEGMKEIRDLLLRLREEGRTLFISSHLLNEVERTCTHAAILRKGKILRSGSITELVSSHPIASLRAEDLSALLEAVRGYPEALSCKLEGVNVIAELKSSDTAALNRFLSERGIHLSHLSLRQPSLEEIFFEVTGTQEEVAA